MHTYKICLPGQESTSMLISIYHVNQFLRKSHVINLRENKLVLAFSNFCWSFFPVKPHGHVVGKWRLYSVSQLSLLNFHCPPLYMSFNDKSSFENTHRELSIAYQGGKEERERTQTHCLLPLLPKPNLQTNPVQARNFLFY